MLNQLLWFIYLILLIFALGPNITYATWIQRATPNQETLLFSLRGIKIINNRIVLPSVLLALIAWIGMVYVSGQSLLIPWVLLTAVFWLLIFLLGLFGYSRTLSRQISLVESVGPEHDDYKSAAWRGTILGIAIGVIALLIILLLAFQPALWG